MIKQSARSKYNGRRGDVILKIFWKLRYWVEHADRAPQFVTAECYEYFVSISSDDKVMTINESGGMDVLASQMSALPNGLQSLDPVIKLAQLIIKKQPFPKSCLTTH